MKKRLLVVLATLIFTFAFATTCFAAKSPNARTLPGGEKTTVDGNGDKDKDKDNNKNRNTGSTSPKTGMDTTIPMIALITAAGVMLISKKEFSKAN